MNERVAVVTGATSGIGFHIASGLARQRYTVVLVARNAAKARSAQEQIASEPGDPARVLTELADLSSLSEVEALAGRLAARFPNLSLLVNNAGVWAPRKTLSADGIELDLAVNHLAPFLLTVRLLPVLRRNGGSRVVNVNSGAHERAKLSARDLAPDAPFKMISAYGKSKLVNMASIVELAARVPAAETTINAVHPGVVATNLAAHGGILAPIWTLMKPFLLSPQQGAETPLWACTAPELSTASGNYYAKKAPGTINPQAQDRHIRAMVWKWTLDSLHLQEGDLSLSPS